MPLNDKATEKKLTRIPRGVWALGFVSLFMDLSSELIHSLLPVFMVTVLGMNTLAVGVIEGIAEATASISKVFSGAISDWIGKRKPLLILGYGLAALSKPLFPLANGISMVFTARFIDRIGKGIRGAPRDAMVADLTPTHIRGAAYGLRQSMDTVGAFAGPILALILMAATDDNFRLVFWFAVIPAFVCVLIILFQVHETVPNPAIHTRRFPIQRSEIIKLSLHYWMLIGFASILTLARFSEAFLILRAENLGLAITWTPLVLITMNAIYALSAYPFGKLADRIGPIPLLVGSILFLMVADILLAMANDLVWVIAGTLFWGLHMGASQGLLSMLVAQVAPSELRGTAFGIFNLITGFALLFASIIAGTLWHIVAPETTFYIGALFSILSLLFLPLILRFK